MAGSIHFSTGQVELPELDSSWSFDRRPGGWIIASKEKDGVFIRKRLMVTESKGRVFFKIDGLDYEGEWIESHHDSAADESSAGDLIAQFPGKVKRVLCAEGESVEKGQALLLVEAMKMEFQVKAPFAGKVQSILVVAEQPVLPGDRFVDIETGDG